MDPSVLTFELLDALEERWVSGGLTDLVTHLEPGLSDARIDELTGPLGIRLPPELRTWFAWRNGGGRRFWTVPLDLWSLQDAVAETQRKFDLNVRVRLDPSVPEDNEFQPSWFLFTGADGRGAYVDTSDDGDTSRIYWWNPEQEPVYSGVASLGRLVELAIEAWDTGWYVRWDQGGWVIDDSRRPEVQNPLI